MWACLDNYAGRWNNWESKWHFKKIQRTLNTIIFKWYLCSFGIINTYGRTDEEKFNKLIFGISLGDEKPSLMLSNTKSLAGRIAILTY